MVRSSSLRSGASSRDAARFHITRAALVNVDCALRSRALAIRALERHAFAGLMVL
ncbi:hypothetical protein [Chondromyces apiculatus]|uniref:hypothetical protein n=1 Tax=Chondromyces apiculatus TaxID=51 RepID=UPI0012DD3CA2|nr:hypothetical protein [Chondromyces apiculatus]